MNLPRTPADLPPDLYEFWAERSAIREFDAGMTRADAEREAWREVVERMRRGA